MSSVSAFQPHFEYALRTCSLNLVNEADCVERIQRLGFRRLPYEERLDLHSLTRRRLRGDLLATYSVFSGGLDLDPSLFIVPPVRPGLRGYPFIFRRVLFVLHYPHLRNSYP